jgi:hypothetical protein
MASIDNFDIRKWLAQNKAINEIKIIAGGRLPFSLEDVEKVYYENKKSYKSQFRDLLEFLGYIAEPPRQGNIYFGIDGLLIYKLYYKLKTISDYDYKYAVITLKYNYSNEDLTLKDFWGNEKTLESGAWKYSRSNYIYKDDVPFDELK